MVAFGKIVSRSLRIGITFVTLAIFLHIGLRIKAFIHIFFEHAGILLTQEEISHAHTAGDTRAAVIPRITHQIFHNWTHSADETLPEDWTATRQTCLDANQDWVHHVRITFHQILSELIESPLAMDSKSLRRLH